MFIMQNREKRLLWAEGREERNAWQENCVRMGNKGIMCSGIASITSLTGLEIKGDRKVKDRIIHHGKELGFYPRAHGKPQNF